MSTFRNLVVEVPTAAGHPCEEPHERTHATPIGEPGERKPPERKPVERKSGERTPVVGVNSVRIEQIRVEQIQALVQQLFFGHESALVRHVAFAPVETSITTAELCIEVARALAEKDKYDIGLIDTHSDPVLLQTHLQIPPPNLPLTTWPIASRLWMVPRQSWLADARGQKFTEQNLWRLRELIAQFDFSILWCAPVSWLTASIGQTCDGLVLILAANKTRRLVAAQIQGQLRKAQVPLLGTVLVERRFPVPQGLYQNL